ncbi:transcription initiation factor TFIID subunit 8-like [Dorcoceras hygrometricum]|uniref:Transcription initiation factor TFIID subunit 8-like n=1 Tax=Dorcoceras hygrometricum TaxID=472368 RepID=A0A2Z7D335_9LAMI|nr:transcription initiation factor TFIID subunit 8-like [Dorcoceras hygrometricum]
MASSLFINTVHVCFESVLAMDDQDMMTMLESLMATGLKGFMGCPAVIHEDELLEFFANKTFELPVEGLTDLTEIPKDLVFDTRSIVSLSGEPVSTFGKKKEMKIEFRLLCDILAKTISVKAGSFDALTMERFLMLTAIICEVKINWNRFEFPSSKILTEKTVHRYVVLNEKVGAEVVAAAPQVTKAPKKQAASKKRLVAAAVGEPVLKKKRTMKKKSGSSQENLEIAMEKFLMLTAIICEVKINWNRVLFNILKDMVTAGSRQAKGNAIQISLLQENIPNLELGESFEFPSSKILTEKTVHRYVVLNEKVGAEVVAAAPQVTKAPKKQAASKKRLVAAAVGEPVLKKKRTMKKKSGSSQENLEIVVAAQEAVPIQIIEPIPVAPVVEPSVEEQREATSSVPIDEDISAVEQPAVEVAAATEFDEPAVEVTAEEIRPPSTDDVDDIIQQETQESDAEKHWFDLPYEDIIAQMDAERPVVTHSDTDDEYMGANEQSVGERIDEDEAMSIEDILMTIPVDIPLPSSGVEITKITLGKDIKIPGVDERTWYLASIPQIRVDDKGKEPPLMEKDPVKGNPVKEQVLFILADIEYLVKLRAKIIDEVAKFFYSFSFKMLAKLQIDDYYFAKEEFLLSWADAESTGVALQRRMYILLKYRELLLRKFLEARKLNFAPSDGTDKSTRSYVEEDVLLEDFEGRPHDRGAVIARTNTNTPSKCWIRTMILVDGVWVVEPCSDHWVKIPKPIVHNEVPQQLSYEDTLPAVNTFFKLMKKIWADVCLAVCEFYVSGKLLPPTILSLRLSQFCTVSVQYSLFNELSIADIHSFVSSIVFERTVLRDVQRIHSSVSALPSVQSSSVSVASQKVQLAFSSVVEDEDNQMDIDQRLASPTTTADSSMNFIDNDTILGDAATSYQPSLPTVSNLSTYLDDFRTLLWQRLDAQSEDIRHIGDSHNNVLSRLNTLDKGLRDALLQQGEDLRKLIQNVRQDGRTLDDVQTLRFNEFRKVFLAHSAAVTADSMDFRKELRALNAKVISLDEQVAATRNDLLEFSAKVQETLNHITDQLSELIAYINRGVNDKKGEVSSSRPQPPPDDQNRGSGNTGGDNVRTTDIVDRFSGSREGRGRGRSGGNRSGYLKRRRYDSGGTFRRSFEDWLG